MNDHIVKAYDNELKDLRSIVSRMGGLAEEQLVAAMKALRELDADGAWHVRSSDRALDQLELEAERAAIVVFARRAPVADDLREVVAALKMTGIIERIGDYAKNISKRTLAINEAAPVVMPLLLDQMADEARRMIQDVMDAYVHRDADSAMEVWERDEALDNLHNAAYRQILARMMENPNQIGALTHFLMIAKNLERIGDQATNIAEQVYYTITGVMLEDARRPKRDFTSTELVEE
jgi:phosphate transport system protein